MMSLSRAAAVTASPSAEVVRSQYVRTLATSDRSSAKSAISDSRPRSSASTSAPCGELRAARGARGLRPGGSEPRPAGGTSCPAARVRSRCRAGTRQRRAILTPADRGAGRRTARASRRPACAANGYPAAQADARPAGWPRRIRRLARAEWLPPRTSRELPLQRDVLLPARLDDFLHTRILGHASVGPHDFDLDCKLVPRALVAMALGRGDARVRGAKRAVAIDVDVVLEPVPLYILSKSRPP